MTIDFIFRLGSHVKHTLHTQEHAGHIGLVVGLEMYADHFGRRETYHVRWMTPEGNVNVDARVHNESELVLVKY